MALINIKITYTFNEDKKETSFEIESDAKDELIPDLLADYIQSVMGKGSDDREANIQDIYTIHLQLELAEDIWSISSDTGNKGLTAGIIMDVLGRLKDEQDS